MVARDGCERTNRSRVEAIFTNIIIFSSAPIHRRPDCQILLNDICELAAFHLMHLFTMHIKGPHNP